MTDDLLKLDNQFCFAVYAVARAVTQAYEPLLRDMGLTCPQYLVMLVLWERDADQSQRTRRAAAFGFGTLTPLIKRLEVKGFLNRSRSDADERTLVIALTAKGRRLRDKAQRVPHGLVCRLGTPVENITKLRDELKRLLVSLDQSYKPE